MAAPKGNLYALGLTTNGRPPMYDDPKEMAKKISEYIDYEDSKKKPDGYSGEGKGIYTLAGCALFLGFASRQQMWEYQQKNEDFNYIILRFKEFLTSQNEQRLYWGGTFAGAMFWLKNWGGYKDESTQNQNQTVTKVEFIDKVREDESK
jgi:hypothetical protein